MDKLKKFGSKLQYIDDPNQIPTEYRTPNICTLCKTDISLKFSKSVAILECYTFFISNVYLMWNTVLEVLTANTLMSLSYLSNTEVIASGQANQPNSESGQANQLNSESGLANQLNSESGQENQQNSKSGQANQPNSEYDKANKLKMSRKRSQKQANTSNNNNEWEPVKVIEAKGPTESIGKYLADLYKAASDASANTAKVIQYEIKSWYNYANKFENRVKELIKTGVKEKAARTAFI
ncbi:hypothetical protein C2G38_2281373 [Gigaspora rosea]|uniref:Uncharacterized protein n=1 Tax=Gigaspora rosea TaxID=44941 RepID=A0A397UDP0_9GLOM|nr:hypothetical protein C2G38_2281373 [Gigaspora rosea]